MPSSSPTVDRKDELGCQVSQVASGRQRAYKVVELTMTGFVMTVADHGMSNLNIVGPSDITHFLASLRGCLQR